MSRFDEFDNDDMINLDGSQPTSKLELNAELEEQLTSLRKKDRVKMIILGFAAGMMVAVGAGLYVTQANADSDPNNYGTSYQSGSSYDTSGSYTDYSQAAGSGGALGGGAGGCCGGGGASGGASNSASLADLEKQALVEYKKDKDAVTDVKAKATNFGCHIQIDISDKSGKVIRSYGYQGSALYVIK